MSGLRGEWGSQFPEWYRAVDERFGELERIPLTILVWGPGPHSPDYPKREQIVQHLRGENEHNEVVTSEQLIEMEPRFAHLSPYEAEELHADAADLIIALVVKERKATGVPSEVLRFLEREDDFRNKAYLVTPRLSRDDRRRGFLDQAWVNYPRERRFNYTQIQYEDCTKIRDWCSGLVHELRKRRYFREQRLGRLGL